MTEVSDILSASSASNARAVAANATELRNATKDGAARSEPVASVQFVNDPLAGLVVTQYLNSNSEVVTQTPPRAVVAYLQDGLTANGFQPEGKGGHTTKTV
ncbi:MAG: hypothetical protein ABTQ34_02060 [Bdellovibrionales bacterium]